MADMYTLHFDGSCWPNPGGTAAYGYTLHKGAELIESKHAVLGDGPRTSNNVAEYAGLYEGLAAFAEKVPLDNGHVFLNVRGDSQLVINQMSGRWNANRDKLYYLHYDMARGLAKTLRGRGARITFDWIPREKNQECDDLSKKHLA